MSVVFTECVAMQGFPFHSGGLGVEGVFSLDVAQLSPTVRNRPQPFATGRNRPREVAMAVPMASSAKGVTFGGFKRCVALFRVAGVALRDIQRCSVTCRQLFCVAVSEDEFQFFWQARHFRRVVFLRIALSGLCQVVTSATSVAGVTFCPM